MSHSARPKTGQPKTARDVRPERAARPERRGGGPQALALSLSKVARRALAYRNLAERSLILDWPSIAGSDIACLCVPRGLRFQHRDRRLDGTLVLGVRAGQATRIQHLEPQLIARINGYLGYRAVARLRLQHGAPPAQGAGRAQEARHPPQTATTGGGTAALPDPALRAALERLGRALKGPR